MERLGAVADFQNLYYNMSENQEKIRGPKELDRTISIFPDRALKFVWRGRRSGLHWHFAETDGEDRGIPVENVGSAGELFGNRRKLCSF